MKRTLIKIVALCLIVCMAVPIAGSAVDENIEPYSSHYLAYYSSYIYNPGDGKIQIWFEVCGTGTMDEIGTLRIEVYEVNSDDTLTWVDTLFHDEDGGMLFSNKNYVNTCVSYQGTAGKTYRAYVCVWAGKDGNGDSRYLWASEI